MSITTFTVAPALPPELAALKQLARNLWFSWNPDATALFRQIAPEKWDEVGRNPNRLLSACSWQRFLELSEDAQFCAELKRVALLFQEYQTATDTWYAQTFKQPKTEPEIAYVSCEFGLHESLPIYSGGLGVLAGDLLKSASDLGIPLLGVGLFYRQGYFHQTLNLAGEQEEQYPENNPAHMPVERCCDAAGEPVQLSLQLGDETVYFQVWRVDVGRVPLLLLDTNLPENTERGREICVRLYDDNRDIRLRQEILLGRGSVRMLRALGYHIHVYHINEGHSAFLLLERLRNLMTEYAIPYEQAREIVRATSIFTTHTPVAAGNERFSPEQVTHYLQPILKEIGLTADDLLALGREDPGNRQEGFCLTVLAFRLSAFANGVSRVHGQVTRKMWQGLFADIPEEDIPIDAIANGVHPGTWIAPAIRKLLAVDAATSAANAHNKKRTVDWTRAHDLDDAKLWQARNSCREELVHFARQQLTKQLRRRGADIREIRKAATVLDPHVLTIGFARRFTAYKRGALFLEDPDRLTKLLLDANRPIQFIIAGKAHPADQEGKAIIRRILTFARDPRFRHRLVFLENYDLQIAEKLIHGADVWLNTPLPPREASGTSGMKAAMNGGLHLSVPDGWWAESYRPDYGWSIGDPKGVRDPDETDAGDSDRLYTLLENDIIPKFYQRSHNGLPLTWLTMMRHAIAELGDACDSCRMLRCYAERYYRQARIAYPRLTADQCAGARELATWRGQVEREWENVEVVMSSLQDTGRELHQGDKLEIFAWVRTGHLDPKSMLVEVQYGQSSETDRTQLIGEQRTPLTFLRMEGETAKFQGSILLDHAGHCGFSVRVLPRHRLFPFLPIST